MKYAMLSTLIPKEYEEAFRKESRNNMQDAANALQWNLYEGFCENLGCHMPLFNILPVDSFPQYYPRPFVKKFTFNDNGINIGFCNIKLIRNFFKPIKTYKVLKAWCRKNDGPKTLFVYTLSHHLLKAVNKAKLNYPDLKVCAIVADLPDMASLSSKKSALQKAFTRWSSTNAYNLISCVDSFVLLTKHMATYMNISQPFVVMEGIASENNYTPAVSADENGERIIMYSGTLHRKFGVLHLLEAFRKIEKENYRLVICGIGDSEAEIRQASKEDSRIIFKGQLSRNEVLELQKQATVLVNPRLNNDEFTKYSFPSKTMEYLASGTPVVAYRLDGIPDEYEPYIFYPADDSIQTLTELLQQVGEMSENERRQYGEAAQKYVLEYKNNIVQTKKIIDFLNDIK